MKFMEMKELERRHLPIKNVVYNDGRIPGVPKNPRQWTKDDLEHLKKSIEETPELLEARGLIVYPVEGKYVAIGGNMRLAACRALKMTDVPCIILPGEIPTEKILEITIKDNGSFGSWDWDMLANEWDDLPLTDWGIPAWDTEKAEEETPVQVQEDDDFDEEKDVIVCRCKKGEIWQCGEHRIMCGDSTDSEAVNRLMGGGKS